MITKFNTYIKENNDYITNDTFAKEMMLFFNKLLPDNTNIEVIEDNLNTIHLEINNIEDFLIQVYTNNGLFYYENNLGDYMRWETINDLKDYIKTSINDYYNVYKEKLIGKKDYLFIWLNDIPVFNTNMYSNFIYELINKEPKLIKQISKIEHYLNEETLKKLEHLQNASKFGLL